MSVDFIPKLEVDPRLQLSSKRVFPVYQGAANVTPQVFPSTTHTPNNLLFTIQVPSLENCVDTVFLLRSRCTINIKGTPAVGQYLFSVDAVDASGNPSQGNAALAAFPAHNLITTANITINQCQFNVDMQNTLPSMLYMVGRDQLSEYNHMCPTMLDNTSDYTQVGYVGSNASVFNSWNKNFDYNTAGRGSWSIYSITGNNALGDGSARDVSVTFETTEPLMVSPLRFGKLSSSLQGIQAINVNLNLDATASRYLKFAAPLVGRSVALTAIDSDIQCVFLAPKASMLASYSPRNVIDFYKLDRYLSTAAALNPNGGIIQSPSIQLSSIPKTMIVTLRPTGTPPSGIPISGTNSTPLWFLPITNANVTFNTQSGLLANASQYQLYKFSQESGVNQSWSEWSGKAQNSYKLDPSGAIVSNPNEIKTVGSVLALSFGSHLNISQEYNSVSSLGQFNLQITCSYAANNYAGNFEMCIVLVNEGLVSTETGNTNSYVNLLSKSVVMSVLGDTPVPAESSTDPVLEGRGRSGGAGGGMSGGMKSRLHRRLM